MKLHEEISRVKQIMGIYESVNSIKQKLMYYEQLMEIMDEDVISEQGDDDEKNDVLEKINAGDFNNDVNEFYDAFMKSKRMEMLTPYNKDELNDMKLFKLNGYDIGYALKRYNNGDEYNEIVSVFNNSGIGGIGKALIESAIRNGGCYLDHYDGFLSDLYGSMGFEEIDRYGFDPQYDPEGTFREKYGESDIIVRKHKDCI
jgi:hypothetical protein